MNTQTSVVGLFLLGLLAGCTSDWDPQRKSAVVTSRAADATLADSAERFGPSASPRSSVTAFASLPDRGELLAYDGNRAVRQRGAYTSHPIRLSEEHALHATTAGGELVVAAPNGELIRLRYERHVEHPDGNWTWVGRTTDGADAVLTFGERAVFGTVPHGTKESLSITTAAGGAWLVATDRSKLPPDVNRATTRSGKPDYLLPPAVSASLASAASEIGMASQDVSAAAAPHPIDVVLGFTNGYAVQLGGASQAVSRLNNLVEIANQAMNNSLVSRRLRLVRAVQVTYPDATDNATALEELTGFRSGSGIPVPAALQPLRTARDEFGGDLVALVRAFRAPESEGCGIAWLIGGGDTPYTANSARFAYSVVGDGIDEDESDGQSYFCRDESLAHELGHNLGQAHNDDDAEQAGAHPYSYGYREASPTGFFTVMAYANSDDQTPIRYFANPAVNFSGRATGIANSADNTRSLNLTMPVAANFRATVVPVQGGKTHNDVDADGKTDLLWRDNAKTKLAYWVMNGASLVRSSALAVGPAWTALGSGDLTGDGRVDIVWSNGSQLVLWTGTGTSFVSSTIRAYPPGYTFAGIGDINGDGKDDLLWRDVGKTRVVYWIMNGAALVGTSAINVGAAWNLRVTGDLNGDNKLDLVWASTSSLVLWTGNGVGFGASTIQAYPAGWSLQAAEDVDGDGKDDLLWRNNAKTLFNYWIMNGSTRVRASSFAVGGAWSIGSYGDLNGDGKADIVWSSSTQLLLWAGNGNGFAASTIGTPPNGWTMMR